MQQNLNPKGKKKSQQDYARNQRNGLAPRPAASGRRRLPALFLACRGLQTFAYCTSPVTVFKKKFSKRFENVGFNGLVSPEMAFTNFLGKKHKCIRQKAG